MQEFDQDGPYMQEGYWDPHSPKDSCLYNIHAQPTPLGFLQGFRRMLAERKPTRFATATLDDFLCLPPRDIVRRLEVGEVFKAEDYLLGTIINFDEESLTLGRSKKPVCSGVPWYQVSTYWGIVAQIDYPQPHSTVLMRISDGLVSPCRPTLEVGEVVHTRRDGNIWAVLQSFRRVTGLDIFAIGTEERSV